MMPQLLAHLFGDYLVQSDWMAIEKRRESYPCFVHCLFYTLCFWPLLWHDPFRWATLVIFGSHFLIDRFGLARYLVWAKNYLAPHGSNPPWRVCSATGYPPERPAWMTVWLTIVADNTLHLLCNYLALKWL